MNPDEFEDNNQPADHVSPALTTSQNVHDEQINPQQGYEWLANYQNGDHQVQQNNSSIKKKIFVALVILIIVSILSVAAILLSSQDQNKDVIDENSISKIDESKNKEEGNKDDNQDKKRKEKLKDIQGKLEVYYAIYKNYPTYEDVTNESWLEERNIKKSEITDPEGKDWKPKNIPTKNAFSYQPLPNNCNNVDVMCLEYKITAVLSDVSFYELKNEAH